MYKPRNQKLSIPIELLEFAFKNCVVKATSIYIFLKFYSDGKVHKDSSLFDLLKTTLGIKDNRTLTKRLKTLLRLNWIGFNEISGNYFIRGFAQVREQYGFKKRHAAVCYQHFLEKLESFFIGAILSKQINVKKFLSINGRRKLAATDNGNVAPQPANPSQNAQQYFGLANSIIAKRLFCKKTRACELKKKAAEDGFIELKKKYKTLAVLKKKDFHLLKYLPETDKSLNGKIKFRKLKRGGILVREQLYDEIIPKVWIKSIGKISAPKKTA